MNERVRLANVLVLATALALGTPTPATAAGTIEGHTTEAFEVSVDLGDDGRPSVFRIEPTGMTCKRGSLDVPKQTVGGLRPVADDLLAQDVNFRERLGKYRLRSTIHVEAEPFEGGGWGGDYERKTKLMKKGRTIDDCVHRTYWYAD